MEKLKLIEEIGEEIIKFILIAFLCLIMLFYLFQVNNLLTEISHITTTIDTTTESIIAFDEYEKQNFLRNDKSEYHIITDNHTIPVTRDEFIRLQAQSQVGDTISFCLITKESEIATYTYATLNCDK